VLARSHVALAVAPYVALLSHPLPLMTAWGPLAVPILRPSPGGAPVDPVLPVALSIAVVALASLAPDLDHAGSTLARVAGAPGRAGTGAVGRAP
jgi:hypothetical protein